MNIKSKKEILKNYINLFKRKKKFLCLDFNFIYNLNNIYNEFILIFI